MWRRDSILPHSCRAWARLACCVKIQQVLRGKLKPGGVSVIVMPLSLSCFVVYSWYQASAKLNSSSISVTAVFVGSFLDRSRLWLAASISTCNGWSLFSSIILNSRFRVFMRRSLGGGMWLSTGSQYTGIDLITPEIFFLVLLSCVSILCTWNYSAILAHNILPLSRQGSEPPKVRWELMHPMKCNTVLIICCFWL